MNLYQNEIIEHAKKSDQNMRVAILAGFSFMELRNSLIRDFANAMMQELKKYDWDEVDIHWWLNEPIGTLTGMACRQNCWPKDVRVMIEAQNGGLRGYIFGVKAEKGKVKEEDRVFIADALNKSFSIGKPSTDWWPWYRDLDNCYRNFDSEETLMALYRRDTMLNDLVGDIERIRKILDSIFPKNA